MSEATSPDAWPPMPSATTKSDNFLSTRKLSSLASRLRPTSVAAQKLSSITGHLLWDPAARNLPGATMNAAASEGLRSRFATATDVAPELRASVGVGLDTSTLPVTYVP